MDNSLPEPSAPPPVQQAKHLEPFSWDKTPKVPGEKRALMKADYLTGQYNSVSLAAKHGVSRMTASSLIHRTGWKEELIAAGGTPPKETGARIQRRSKEFWDQVELDYMRGDEVKDIYTRYDLPYQTLYKHARIYRWPWKRRRVVKASNNGKLLVSKTDTAEKIERMTEIFIDSAMVQLQKLIDDMENHRQAGKAVDLERFDKMLKLFSTLYDSIKKVPALKQPEKPKSPTGAAIQEHGGRKGVITPLAQQKAPVLTAA